MKKPPQALRAFLIFSLLIAVQARGIAQTPYWENPSALINQRVSSTSVASGSSFMAVAWQDIKPKSAADRTSGTISVSLAVSANGIDWTTHAQVFGPVPYAGVTEGSEPRVYSMAIDSQDRIALAITATDRETVILQSTDKGNSFQQVQRLASTVSAVVPNVFALGNGGFLLLLSQGTSGQNADQGSVFVESLSRDGRTWSPLTPFITAADKVSSPQLQPAAIFFQGKDYVFFQALTARGASGTSTWQLYAKASGDAGASWDSALPVSSQAVFGADAADYNNERPRLSVVGTQMALVWERSPYGSERPQIWTARLDAKAAVVGSAEVVTPSAPSRFAQVLVYRGTTYVVYQDGSGNTSHIVLAQKAKTWETQLLQNTAVQNAVSPHVLVFNNSLYMFWENQAQAGVTSSIVRLRPLTSVGAPVVRPVDFVPGTAANRDSVTVNWTEPLPLDPSGIKEYRYAWTYTGPAGSVEVERATVSGLNTGGKALSSTRKTDKDGTWTFSVTALDLAGNLTQTPATVAFTRDATPPKAVAFQVLGGDGSHLLDAPSSAPESRADNGFAIATNTFTLRWVPGGDTDIVGYTFNLQPGWATLEDYVQSTVPLLAPPPRLLTTATERTFLNADNGVYALTVRAIDRAGNFSPASTVAVALTQYQIVTRIDFVTTQKDPVLGTVAVTINGRGFLDNGPIRKIYLYRGAAKAPYDIEIDPVNPVRITDRQISGIELDQNQETGSYKVGLLQDRPTGQSATYHTPAAMFRFESPGTVKVGNFEVQLPTWIVGQNPQFMFSFDSLLVVLIVGLLGTLSVLAVRKIIALAQEGAAVRGEVVALLQGRPNMDWEERKKRMQALSKRGRGLRFKFTLLTVILVTMIVLIVSVPLGFQMVNRERLTRASGLQSSANILLGALAASAESQIQIKEQGFEGALQIPSLRTTMSEARRTTITGPQFLVGVANNDAGPAVAKDFVWASDEDRFVQERAAKNFISASETVGDELAKGTVLALQKQIDADAAVSLAALVSEYRTIRGKAQDLQTKTDAVSRAALGAASLDLSNKRAEIDAEAKKLYAKTYALPEFKAGGRLQDTYIFYEPIIFYNKAANLADTSFYQGMVRLTVDATDINRQISNGITTILKLAGGIALLAIALGILGAIIMANITITPIQKLARGVAVIRDTEDKEDLKTHSIDVNTRDEIGQLAETVNEMIKGLVKAAVANKALLQGIDVQKRFLPLLKEKSGVASSTALEENDRLEIFGYYKGATGVSGDYFDFRRLDDTYYALIKCDVSGKGVSAALIMVEVATLFINYFRDWPKRKENIAQIKEGPAKQRALRELERLDSLVYTINDMVEERGFVGKFAALTVMLYNSATGIATVCNAGDTVMNIYSVEKQRMLHENLPSAPAAGMFPRFMVDLKTPYKQIQHHLVPGDVLFLATDGFEDAIHTFRDAEFNEMDCDEPGLEKGQHHQANGGDHEKGLPLERFGMPREDEVINAVFRKGQFTLIRNHNPLQDEQIVFDFSGCEGTAQEAVLALVAVDRVYRMVPNPRLGEEDRISIDAKVVDFLKAHFIQYDRYFSHRLPDEKEAANVTFTHAMEDEQSDDLTILVFRRK